MAKKILIVEDEKDILALTRIRLYNEGYAVTGVGSGAEACRMLETQMPDLVLLDLLLPGKRGEDVCRYIKQNGRLKHIPVILFTATAQDVARIAHDLGADGYVMKPFEPDELLQKIKSLIG